MWKFVSLLPFLAWARADSGDIPYYIHPCHASDPNLNECLVKAGNHFASNYRRGIPELGIKDPEPIVLDEVNLALGSGPDGYRATFMDVHAYGSSNLTVTNVRSDLESLQFQVSLYIPKIRAKAHYRSSGVLIMVQASGGGDYWGEYEGVKAKIYFKAKRHDTKQLSFLTVEDVKMDFSVKDIKMGIENIHNGNMVIEAAMNLFINSNAQDLLKEMKPSIKTKIVALIKEFLDNLFQHVPYNQFIVE